ncbi:hypothetical protein DBV15_02758 [Temnothorax longispinosus]|uniref:Uncharacterized protein n=1 Tax=Temnothorax longispinosus TaxID=300112 RepID=A0A4S2KG27_9HYME|nr:hypothetical protein DBV15_02758 [Temnothorax longispinosus]
MSASLRILALISLAAQNVAWPQDPIPRLHLKHPVSYRKSHNIYRITSVKLSPSLQQIELGTIVELSAI